MNKGRLLLLVLMTTLFSLLSTTSPTFAATTWRYTALGDSLGTGFGSWYGYVYRYRDYIAADTGNDVLLTNQSVNGWTSADLANALQTDADLRNAVASAQVVTWNIGGNDLLDARNRYIRGTCGGVDQEDCLRQAVVHFKRNWDQIVDSIQGLRAGQPTLYRTMDVYNPFVDEDKHALGADRSKTRFEILKPYLDEINRHIHERQTKGYDVAKVYDAFNGPNHDQDPGAKGLLFWDGVHPNDQGQRLIAEAFRKLGYASLH
ncbi:hypothetical protein C1X05_14405 [Laceyella sacchari]|nr:hypothetical protein C1X05_14405 [Laceyella sacchari]